MFILSQFQICMRRQCTACNDTTGCGQEKLSDTLEVSDSPVYYVLYQYTLGQEYSQYANGDAITLEKQKVLSSKIFVNFCKVLQKFIKIHSSFFSTFF
ncbi:hypothetical protein U14_05285 [Candidatus Moduliflexus flocculans]|uniref:Uncharacterized protein n=1 Tax=Candidatus Moduliflexus flocculans TaxID=1499966 RepID=A0A081BRH7_9BACT|nr:hypothetical protein U14_05285 [Candidatus Moduliflexus flocculans]